MALTNLSRRRFLAFVCDTESERPPIEYPDSILWVRESNKLYWSENGQDHEIGGSGGGDISGAWPIGSVFLSVVNTDPATLLGFGTWAQIAQGRMLIGQDPRDADFDTAEETGGEKTHTLTAGEVPAHAHRITDPGHSHGLRRYSSTTGSLSGFTADTSMSGSLAAVTLTTQSAATGITGTDASAAGGAHNNLPPYFVVYAYKRTA